MKPMTKRWLILMLAVLTVFSLVATACKADETEVVSPTEEPAVVDDTLLHQVNDVVADHFRVNAQVFMISKISQCRVGYFSDAALQR